MTPRPTEHGNPAQWFCASRLKCLKEWLSKDGQTLPRGLWSDEVRSFLKVWHVVMAAYPAADATGRLHASTEGKLCEIMTHTHTHTPLIDDLLSSSQWQWVIRLNKIINDYNCLSFPFCTQIHCAGWQLVKCVLVYRFSILSGGFQSRERMWKQGRDSAVFSLKWHQRWIYLWSGVLAVD